MARRNGGLEVDPPPTAQRTGGGDACAQKRDRGDKTWVLSSRYARLLLTDAECLPRDILTLTYTEAAASEMRERIERRVRELLSAPGAPVSADRIREVTDGFGEAWISTIHAFAARMIRESGLSLDVDPRASVVSSPQEDALRDRKSVV